MNSDFLLNGRFLVLGVFPKELEGSGSDISSLGPLVHYLQQNAVVSRYIQAVHANDFCCQS